MKDVFVLMTNFGSLRGVYTSKKMMCAGVNYWMNLYPNETLVYQGYMPNYIPGNLDKHNQYVYISSTTLLGGIMDNVPRNENLVGRTDIAILNKLSTG